MEHLPSVLRARQRVGDATASVLTLAAKARATSRPSDYDLLKRGAESLLDGAEAVLLMCRAVEQYHLASTSAALVSATPRVFSGEPMLAASTQKRTVHGRTRSGASASSAAAVKKRGGGAAAKRKNASSNPAPKRPAAAATTITPEQAIAAVGGQFFPRAPTPPPVQANA